MFYCPQPLEKNSRETIKTRKVRGQWGTSPFYIVSFTKNCLRLFQLYLEYFFQILLIIFTINKTTNPIINPVKNSTIIPGIFSVKPWR